MRIALALEPPTVVTLGNLHARDDDERVCRIHWSAGTSAPSSWLPENQSAITRSRFAMGSSTAAIIESVVSPRQGDQEQEEP